MGRSAEKTLRLLREVADRREPWTEAKNHFLRTEFFYHAFAKATLSADRYLEIIEESLAVNEKLAVYEKVVDDESATRELRVLLARRANWLRISARLRATEKSASGLKQEESGDSEPRHSMDAAEAEALLFSPIRMAGNLRERANEACQKIVKMSKQPGVIWSLSKRALPDDVQKNKPFAWKISATRPL